MNNDNVIRVENISKSYRLGQISSVSLREDITQFFSRFRAPSVRPKIEKNIRHQVANSKLIWALNNISFSVARGEILGLAGTNGAGKSTLLKILSRITSPTLGRIFLRGRVASLLEVGTGFHPELTGRDNIFMNGVILGMRRYEIARKLDDIIDFSGIARFADTPIKRYSSGMTVRLGFAVAAFLEPEILFVDEVLAVGDFEFQRRCLGRMKEVSNSGRTIIFVSHQTNAMRSLCHRVALLEDGELTCVGNTNEVLNRYISKADSQALNSSVTWQDDPKSPFRLKGATLLNANDEEQSLFDISERISVEITFEVSKTLKGSHISAELHSSNHCIFITFDTDANPNLLEERAPYIGKCRFTIPAFLLKPGTYSIRLNTGIANSEAIHSPTERLTFSVGNETEFDSFQSFSERRAGLIAQRIEWKNLP